MGIRFSITHILIITVLTVGIAVFSRAQLRERPPQQATVAALTVRDDLLQTEVAIAAKVLEVNRTSLADLGFGPASTVIMNVSESTARSLATAPQSKVLQNFQLSTLGPAPAQFRVSSRIGSDPATTEQPFDLDAGFDFEMVTTLSVKREISLTLLTRAKISRRGTASGDVADLFTGQWVRHEITTAEGAGIVAGGLVPEEDRKQLIRMAALKDSPVLRYLFASGADQSSEIVVLLWPRVVRAPAGPISIESISPHQSPITHDRYTVQVGAFRNQANALALLTELAKSHPQAFIQTISGDAVVYRVRVGGLSDLQDVKQLEKQLRSEGFHPLVLASN